MASSVPGADGADLHVSFRAVCGPKCGSAISSSAEAPTRPARQPRHRRRARRRNRRLGQPTAGGAPWPLALLRHAAACDTRPPDAGPADEVTLRPVITYP